ncbi:MAG TPA: 3-methyl-2-oxobutanoate dehydrogenase subunit VorB [Methanothrix soehngenii]|jgi:2-oxoisovalerate ferredoxin oxidoreductase alpha subunit|uniref:Ketoisovalerate oxidoreductase subunit n=3 Tax=root TaxID=1 RepID=F4BXZ4_METSG|nr:MULTISPECIES: 3-methyl-2-oxobutanoate dehydrogenase subunit VorB [Methanothrix]AEB67578.1 ketoisovalerate oxidoreductase subunit [Methanothrix soehngenii GP6]NLJ23252.1 3-methyl-2-oxobutanoate dehydrogenase subunit VorB [Methanothrix soehngenii]HNQ52225.1 3-methyl-2-oxobutanoate dehydrogenase subunit VorB [Methanothrix soehngenii]HNT46010.1 3-methyl-2-oxobutanoate dehydrogenase subunit VorB [Methanothrix soehngenii]HOE46217.1 3-methyl-2-oxobutanoate dehydrogenase subunit VorB [Methanothrix 
MASGLMAGNSAVIVGALYAGCDCFFGYPITPASEILQEASKFFPLVGRKFVQAESEEAAINMVYGAATAGHRVLAASSGPGMSLKQEGITYIAGAQLPCVIVDICRAGPGLGNIGPEQSDYNQACKGGGHGCYHNIVLAPASVQEMCDFTRKGFDLAFKYRNPVIILADGVLGHMVEPLQFPQEAIEHTIDTTWAVAGRAETRGNLVTSISLDFGDLEKHNLILQEKYRQVEENEVLWDGYRLEDADVVLVSYGISSRIARSAVDSARKEGIRAGLFRPITLYPFPTEQIAKLADRGCKFISVEMSNGQMRDDIRLASGCRPVELVCRYGGNLINIDEIMDKIREVA